MQIPPSPFQHYLLAANPGLAATFSRWEFLPGMLFGSREKWWDRAGQRPRPHEGLDLCSYIDRTGKRRWLETDTAIPALFSGILVGLCRDFIGRSLFVESRMGNGLKIIWALGHLRLREDLQAGRPISAGQVLGTLADAGTGRGRIKSHLHISLALPAGRWNPVRPDWSQMADPGSCELLDPLSCILA